MLLLIIIYIAFISLGLPDALLGVTWPIIHIEMSLDEGLVGVIAMIISMGTIVSSLISSKLTRNFGTGKVTMISVLMTAIAILGMSFSKSFIWFVILAIPYGLGAGAVDASLNDYVSKHYKSRHMSWLHSFWGVGAMIGPIIMSYFISWNAEWRSGYVTVSILQFGLFLLLLISLPLWNKLKNRDNLINFSFENKIENKPKVKPLKIKGVKIALMSFLFYCSIEYTMGLWGSSYLINVKGVNIATAALWVSLYYGGITGGRFLSGFLSMRIKNKLLIRGGEILVLSGVILLLLPLPVNFSLIGFIVVGLGCAPIYPSMLHSTPERFGRENSSDIMGIQMAVAYFGGAFMPPLIGFVATRTTFSIITYILLSFILIMLISSEIVNKKIKIT